MSDKTGKVPKADRAAATAAYLAGPHEPVLIYWTLCKCAQYEFPHEPHRVEKSVFDYHRSLKLVNHEMQHKDKPGHQRRNLLPKATRPRRRP